MSTTRRTSRYHEALASLPESGGGGCHRSLLGGANHGVLAGLAAHHVEADLRARVRGRRHVPDAEIRAAVAKAVADHPDVRLRDGTVYCPPRPPARPATPIHDPARVRDNLIACGAEHVVDDVDVWEASPIRIDWPPEEDSWRVLGLLYNPGDLLFIGEREQPGNVGMTIRATDEWVADLRGGLPVPPHVIPNPLSGRSAPKRSGEGESLRGDLAIVDHRFVTIEFDSLPRMAQLQLYAALPLPFVALIDAGGKSIHAWVRADRLANHSISNHADWCEVVGKLYAYLTPLGADPACRNASRLSRTPGAFRTAKESGDTGRWQRLLWCNPDGGRIVQ